MRLLHESEGRFRVSLSLSGTWLSQCEQFEPKLLELYQQIISHPNTEILCETSHHTLSSLFDPIQFSKEISEHRKNILRIFGKNPKIFRNTELIYSNNIGSHLAQEGFTGCMMEGWEHLLESDFNANHIFTHPQHQNFFLLPRCYRRSDDIAFRFSNRNWSEWPLTGEKFQSWIESEKTRKSSFLGLFMDFETMGEHQGRDTGIFNFFEYWTRLAWTSSTVRFVTPSQAIQEITPVGPISTIHPISWADTERDVSAWLGNENQRTALYAAYELGKYLQYNPNQNPNQNSQHSSQHQRYPCTQEQEFYQRILTSDHFYYMSTKCSADGEVHGYFSPFSEPLEAYLEYRNVLSEIERRLQNKKENNL